QGGTVDAPQHNVRVYILAIVTSMGAFLFGYDLAFIGTSIELAPFKRDFGLEGASEAVRNSFSANIVSLLQAGCFFGSLAAAPVSDKLGRRLGLALGAIAFIAGSIMQTASAGNKPVMFVGRVIGGVGVGFASMLVPLYTAECAPPKIRGRLVGIYEIGVQIGTCLGFWINYGVDRNMAPTSSQWMTPFALQLIPGGLLIIGLIFMPESPRWMAKAYGRNRAVENLSLLRGLPVDHPAVEEEVSDILHQLDIELSDNLRNTRAAWKELMQPGLRNRVFIGIMIMVFFQMCGSNSINYYSPQIFGSIGLQGAEATLVSTGIYGIVRLVAVFFAMYFVVDRFGRKAMLIGGSVMIAISMWLIGVFVKVQTSTANSGGSLSGTSYAAVVFIFVFAVSFCFSWAGVPWVICSEIYPLRVRGLCVSICVATHWLVNFVIARSTPYMISNIGFGTYFVFAACTTLAVPFVWFMVPETKGMKLEEVDALFEGRGLIPRRKQCVETAEEGTDEKGAIEQIERV
ncbi:sugar transporter, partial [Penicillium maclennaniae]|uniref:sugar transporter n=1 Tax=Penicillium maclennaniae TaxID=1343394 RepID=UPI002540DFCC